MKVVQSLSPIPVHQQNWHHQQKVVIKSGKKKNRLPPNKFRISNYSSRPFLFSGESLARSFRSRRSSSYFANKFRSVTVRKEVPRPSPQPPTPVCNLSLVGKLSLHAEFPCKSATRSRSSI
ncbi:hypothetical protein GWI33_020354 [Rhynchophorus ferrugineus]|uniref:Uncharacterized protein n=1 Tax=Rhynchophorus ferrugineus TaxID=354439 RepID=A0A834M3G8_RHYFE|nr:hypothetical protein GWI33_020354 [Rhynchophorus ferrugineus]